MVSPGLSTWFVGIFVLHFDPDSPGHPDFFRASLSHVTSAAGRRAAVDSSGGQLRVEPPCRPWYVDPIPCMSGVHPHLSPASIIITRSVADKLPPGASSMAEVVTSAQFNMGQACLEGVYTGRDDTILPRDTENPVRIN